MSEENKLQTRPLETIESEINFYKQQTAMGIIEIGKRLIEAKEQIKGEETFREWCKKLDFGKSTAYNFIRCATEYSNISLIEKLGTGKLFKLLTIPQEDREEFISNPHEVNGQTKTVDEMTTRELQKVIKEEKIKSRKPISNITIKHITLRSQGRCEICGWGGQGLEGVLVPHHIHKYSETKDNSSENLVMICPNCHGIIHTLENCQDKNIKDTIFNSIDKELANKINIYINKLINMKEND
jgi:5-methylcytosine-specific restriction endonuclease McrA